MSATFEPVTGRYMHLDLFGRAHRIYVEEAGQGTPLLCLHTAGSDGRQYRGLMNHPGITANHRVIAFDMPWHGKSSPPAGWHDEEYQLTSAQYTAMILDIMTALELDRPIVMGCSIGGRIALHLALEHPERFRAIIGLQAGAHVDPYYDLNFLHRPDVHGGEVSAAIVSGLVGPSAPAKERWETLWHYMQGGPGVFKGDLYFYKIDGDIRDRVGQIDTKRCPLFLLSGEYDYSCTPEETLAVAASIPGAEVTIMKGLGHFPMSENPEAFIGHLLPVLDKIRNAACASMNAVTKRGIAGVKSAGPRTRWMAASSGDWCVARLASIFARSASPGISTSRMRMMAIARTRDDAIPMIVRAIVRGASGRFPPRPRARRCRGCRPSRRGGRRDRACLRENKSVRHWRYARPSRRARTRRHCRAARPSRSR